MELNEEKLHEFVGKMVVETGAAANAPLVLIGEKLGLFTALKESGPLTSQELAKKTGTSERYVREWLAAQAASEYITYDAAADRFYLSPEQAMVFADNDSPVLLTGAFYSIASIYSDLPKLERAFRTGEGIGWGDHDSCLFCGVARFFRPSYQNHLVGSWIPALEGVTEKLRRGAKVADVGCGHAHSTILMAQAFPDSTFVGFDPHEPSLEAAREHARSHGLTNVRFEKGFAQDFSGSGYDLVTCFDCLHDMGDPLGAAMHVRKVLAPGGTWMVVEPNAGDSLAENLNPVGRTYYAFSTSVCTPAALADRGGAALGNQAGEKRLGEIIRAGGFGTVRRATETPFNMILEARA